MSKVVMPVFHLSVVLLNLFSLWYDQEYVDIPFPAKVFEEMPFKARAVFLTMWTNALQTLYFTIALLNDIFGTNAISPKKTPLIRISKDLLFTIAFPTALYVSIAFWSIYAVDKDMIFPEYVALQCPAWLNHVLHTLILPFIVTELILCYRKYPSRNIGFSMIIAFNVLYVIWLHFIYVTSGVWVYPIFEFLNLPLRIAFFIASTCVALSIYILGEKLNSFVWSRCELVELKCH